MLTEYNYMKKFDIIGATRDLEQKFLKMEQRENES